MLSLSEMLIRLVVAAILGAMMGFEREMVRKEAGIRTNMLVAAGSALFTMSGLVIHYVIGQPVGEVDYMEQVMQSARGIAIVAGIVTGIGFLGAGVIIQDGARARGLTTAAVIWFAAALGVLAGMGLLKMAVLSSVVILFMMTVLRKTDPFWASLVTKKEEPEKPPEE